MTYLEWRRRCGVAVELPGRGFRPADSKSLTRLVQTDWWSVFIVLVDVVVKPKKKNKAFTQPLDGFWSSFSPGSKCLLSVCGSFREDHMWIEVNSWCQTNLTGMQLIGELKKPHTTLIWNHGKPTWCKNLYIIQVEHIRGGHSEGFSWWDSTLQFRFSF